MPDGTLKLTPLAITKGAMSYHPDLLWQASQLLGGDPYSLGNEDEILDAINTIVVTRVAADGNWPGLTRLDIQRANDLGPPMLAALVVKCGEEGEKARLRYEAIFAVLPTLVNEITRYMKENA